MSRVETAQIIIGVVFAAAIVGALVLAGGILGGGYMIVSLGVTWFLLNYLLTNPTRLKRVIAAILAPITLFLLFLPRPLRSQLEELKEREGKAKERPQ